MSQTFPAPPPGRSTLSWVRPLTVSTLVLVPGLGGCEALLELNGAGNEAPPHDGDDDLSGTGGFLAPFAPGAGGVSTNPGVGGTVLGPGSGGNGPGGSGGTATGGDGDGAIDRGPGTPTLPNGRGASVHFITYEAEDGTTNGQILGPTRAINQVAGEASGRQTVRLDSPEEHVSIQTTAPSNSIVVRYSIPDGGHDHWTTLSVFVGTELRATLTLTSRWSWTYGDEYSFANPAIHENPASGHPHHFFDEARALLGHVPSGSTVTVKKTASDTAAHYDIDFIETELVPPPLPQPANAFSITECGATPNDDSDDSAAIQSCIEAAQNTGMGVYIPEGTFRSASAPLSVPGLTITGAGMWYSVISGYHARMDCYQPGCTFRDFSILGDTVQRLDDSPETAFGGQGSSNVTVERVWVEHTKTGYWTGTNTDSLTIRDCRFRNLMADGVNFWGGVSNSVVENSHFRNTGDDAIAGWAEAIHSTNHHNRFSHNYVQIPWKANCFALYGGYENVIEDNVCSDTVQYPGILLARAFGSHAFSGKTYVRRNTLIRAGGWVYDKGHGALKLHAQEGAVQGIEVSELEIIDPSYSGIHVEGPQVVDSVWLDGVTVNHPGTAVFLLDWGSQGALDAAHVIATGSPAGITDLSNGSFGILRGNGNSGW